MPNIEYRGHVTLPVVPAITAANQPTEDEISNFNAFIEQYLPEYSGSPISERVMDMLDAVRGERSDEAKTVVADYYNRNR